MGSPAWPAYQTCCKLLFAIVSDETMHRLSQKRLTVFYLVSF